jgi:hypothetical protein
VLARRSAAAVVDTSARVVRAPVAALAADATIASRRAVRRR